MEQSAVSLFCFDIYSLSFDLWFQAGTVVQGPLVTITLYILFGKGCRMGASFSICVCHWLSAISSSRTEKTDLFPVSPLAAGGGGGNRLLDLNPVSFWNLDTRNYRNFASVPFFFWLGEIDDTAIRQQ